MVDWNAVLQALLTSATVAAAIAFILKKYTEKTIEYTFDRKMKEYEARLRESTELRIGIGKDRVEEYKKLSGLVQSTRKHAVDLCDQPEPSLAEIANLRLEVERLQETIYSLSITLNLDQVYEKVHSYKVRLGALPQYIDNERELRQKDQIERAKGVRDIIDRSIINVQEECQSIVSLLVNLISSKEDLDRDLKAPMIPA